MDRKSEPARQGRRSDRRQDRERSWTVQQKFWFLIGSALVCWAVIVALILLI